MLPLELENALVVQQRREDLVLELAQLDVGLSKKVPGPARRVEEPQGRDLVMESAQLIAPLAVPDALGCEDAVQLGLELAQEQWVDQPVDVLRGGIVHAPGASGLGVQGGLEHPAEHGGADLGPVGALTDLVQEHVDDLLGQLGDLHVRGEQATVDVGEGLQRF